MFRPSTIIRGLALNLAKVIFTLKHLVKLRRYLLCGCVAACDGMVCVCVCVLHAVQNVTESHSAQHATHMPFHHMLPHNHIINNDIISRKYNFSQVQCKPPDDGRRPKHVGAMFMCILM